MNAHEQLIKARALLILNNPFFGCLALKLELEESNDMPTCATDGEKIYYNTEFVRNLSLPETKAILAHEVLHCALGHTWRQGSRDNRKWNIAADYAINLELVDAGFTLPKGCLINKNFKGLGSEEIYNKLPDPIQQPNEKPQSGKNDENSRSEQTKEGKGKGHGCPDPGKCGGVMAQKNKKKQKETAAEWKAAVSQAVQISQGTLPGGLKRQLKEMIDPTVPWYILLRDFVERTAKNDYNWNIPSRRYFGSGIVMPSLISEELPEIVVAIDTSGSIDERQLDLFASEASAVFDAYDTTIRIIYCDTKVQKTETFTKADMPMKLKPHGGGGTAFNPVFEYVAKEGIQPACLIYFTDLYGTFPKNEPEYPVMWLTKTKDKKAPWGQTVLFK